MYVEEHRNVTVLYADIVNFTPLTTTLPSGNLVALLNELFGKFDEAAKVSLDSFGHSIQVTLKTLKINGGN